MKFLYPVLVLLFVVTACAQHASGPQAQGLEERVNQLLEAKESNTWAVVYALADESYRKNVSQDTFLAKKRGMTFLKYEILELDQTSPDQARVVVSWDFSAQGHVFAGQKETQTWVREHGVWNVLMPQDRKFGFE